MFEETNFEKDVIPPMRKNVSHSPHVVILGAGASKASFPTGDKNGNHLPLMNSLGEAIRINEFLPEKYTHLISDFEKLYNVLLKEIPNSEIITVIEDRVYQYFYELEIPATPVLYDYLLLSLREKDIIATFNWDPLLLQCLRRHHKIKNLPRVVFLHGNVGVGICNDCELLGYNYNSVCHRCNKSFEPMQLLYPVEKKDYSSDKAINGEWDQIKRFLEHGFYTTVFGYSAPDSDIDAKDLMLKAVKANRSRVFSEFEIIDIKPENEIEANWTDFFYKSHFRIINDFKKSYLWHHPRRSCDAFASAYLMNTPWSNNTFPEFNSITEMHDWLEPLLKDEEKVEADKSGFTYKAK